jgi:beta-galactosidase
MCHTNYDQVELFLNGKLLGSREVPRWGHLQFKVRYSPGVLSVKGYRKGVFAAAAKVETTGEALSLSLKPYGADLIADGSDVMPVEVSVLDSEGRLVPTASPLIRFGIQGPGSLAGVGNGDPSCHERDKASQRTAFHGLCAVFVRSGAAPGSILLKAETDGLPSASLSLQTRSSGAR